MRPTAGVQPSCQRMAGVEQGWNRGGTGIGKRPFRDAPPIGQDSTQIVQTEEQ